MGGDSGPHKPVDEPTTDSQFGEDETGDGAVLAPPRHRSGLDDGGLSADPQGRCSGHRRRHGGRLRSEPGGQSSGSPGSHQVRPLSRAASPPSIHPQSGWLAKDARHSNLRKRSMSKTFCPVPTASGRERSAHQVLRTLQNVLWAKRLYWVLDIDIRKYFDSISHSHLRAFLDQRVTDGVIRRMIDKWLKAGAVEDGFLRRTTEGSPQGGVISPCLSNVFLHHVLDEWFETEVKPRLRGECTLVRFADDALMAFDNIVDAKRVLSVLGKRLARYGLTLHPDKTRLVDFRPKRSQGARHPETDGTTFDFLGLTHVWGRSRNGKDMVRKVTATGRLARAVAAVNDWCRKNRHWSLRDQHRHLSSMMRGHFAYYGVGGTSRRLRWFANQVARVWRKWLSRRDRQGVLRWARFNELLARHPLPSVKIFHGYAAASEALS